MGASEGGGQASTAMRPGPVDLDRRLAEAFQAPEGVWNKDAERIRLDVFALGALAYYVLVGRPAAADRAALRERLHRDNGLDLAADLPQVPSAVRALVLEATRPVVSERLADVRSFLERLAEAERALAGPAEDVVDPLGAVPGAVIDGRFRLERRLGQGSTAVGLLVTDLSVDGSGPDAVRVLKVARDDAAASRIAGEAEVLAGLADPRLVRLVEGPVEVGGRQALVLESAGEETLGEMLRGRERLSLDLLERWGTDLLEALVALDRAGVDHRDIKPANLGVREGRSDRAKHLVLFDFSLSRAGAAAVTAGTPPYLDPFLDAPERGRYDSAAERYAAAVVLFEMATGAAPRFGDGLSDPASVRDEATIEVGMFDPAVAGPLVAFFRTALARSAKERHDTATEMLAAWRSVFAPVPRTIPDEADERAAQVESATPLAESGLSARGLSALEPYGVVTVGDLVAVDPVRLNRLSGVAEATRREVKSRARQWRDKFGQAVTGRGAGREPQEPGIPGRPDPVTAAGLLLEHAGTARAVSRRTMARLILGLDPGLDPFASQAELATPLRVSRARVAQQAAALQDGWADHPACRDLLDGLAEIARQALAEVGGVATVGELASSVLAALPPADAGVDVAAPARIGAGLLRLALDRARALNRADAGEEQVSVRRRDGRIVLLAADPALLDPAEALGRVADELVAQARSAGDPLVPAGRGAQRLREDWARAAAGAPPPGLGDGRLLRLAAALARDAALSGSNELYHRDLAVTDALALALKGAGGTQAVTAHEIRDRVRARFPALPPLPDRPRLDQLLADAGLGLVYDDAERGYRWPTRAADTKGLASREATVTVPPGPQLVSGGRSGHRLAESASTRSFLALGVDADRADRAVRALTGRLGAAVIDVTGVLVETMRAQAAEVGLPWDLVQAADAAPTGSRDAAGLAALVQRSLPAVEDAITAALVGAPDGTRPVVLTEIAPLARYGHLAMLSQWTDLAARRPQAIWVVVPQLAGSIGAIIDKRPLPLAAPGQFFRLDAEWIDARPADGGQP